MDCKDFAQKSDDESDEPNYSALILLKLFSVLQPLQLAYYTEPCRAQTHEFHVKLIQC